MRSDILMHLGDDTFVSLGLSAEQLKRDMEIFFQRIKQIYDSRELWRNEVSIRETEVIKANEV
jgi:hypothetical protein